MKKIFLLVIFLSTAVFAESIAIVKMTEGNPVVQRDGKNLNLSVGDNLNDKDILITDKSSKVGVIFNDGSTLTLSEGSFLNIEEFTYKPIEEKYIPSSVLFQSMNKCIYYAVLNLSKWQTCGITWINYRKFRENKTTFKR